MKHNQVKNSKFAGFSQEILLESEDFIRFWPARARALSVEICTH